ncbi:anti-sigma F factor antagonist [Oxobacter pfennigii]|uniref:Anti-sigma F factor antagonist n=1 Tax=Oxobacter pfennigii TaxID=36849 RepID=A0A0P8YZN7_9CLOT|nr:anti-sigma F factor antagonist [Oxobacter pfennigii]KPU45349.1 anti-sigma F factor antagonist [Oxobacter pfennigii]
MRLNLKTINKTLVITVFGDIDHHSSDEMRERIDRFIDNHSIRNIIFDFTNVNFMDSAGIGVIIGRYRKVSDMDGKVAIVNSRLHVKKLLEISGVHKIVGMYEEMDTAITEM